MEKIALWIVVVLFLLVAAVAIVVGLIKIGWFVPFIVVGFGLLAYLIYKKKLAPLKALK